MSKDLRFDGRVAIVTGAGGGLGRSHALLLAARGAKVVVNDLGGSFTGEGKSASAADKVVAEIKAAGGEAVASHDSVEDGEQIVKTAIDAFGKIDILINNAGILRDVSFQKMTQTDWDLVYRVHVLGAFRVTHAAWNHMRDAGYGRIVNVGSANGIRGAAGFGPYNASKEAIRALTRTAAREWARYGIVTNCYCPAAAGHRDRPPDGDLRADAWDAMYSNHPMSRDGDPEEDIAPVVLFLCSPAAQWLNGETLMLDGGGYMTA